MRVEMNRSRRPFWLPASNYYVLAVAVSAAFFFLVWGVLHDEGDDMPWVTAGIGSSMLLGGAVILRAIIFRRERRRFFIDQRKTSGIMTDVLTGKIDPHTPPKLTLEINAAILHEIQKKSDAANTLSRISGAHREVVELCGEYMARIEIELRTLSPVSPRLAPLLRGRSAVSEFHRYHLLKWAEIEARTLTLRSKSGTNKTERIKSARKALDVIESALESYPVEASLLQSQDLLREMVVSMKVAVRVEKAGRATQSGKYEQARILYRDALFDLGRDNVHNRNRAEAAKQINIEIDRLRILENGDGY